MLSNLLLTHLKWTKCKYFENILRGHAIQTFWFPASLFSHRVFVIILRKIYYKKIAILGLQNQEGIRYLL